MESKLLLAPDVDEATTWRGQLELPGPTANVSSFQPRSAELFETGSDDWWYAFDGGVEAKALVDGEGGLVGWLAVDDTRAAFLLDLDGDELVDYYEDTDARFHKRYVMNDVGRAFADDLRSGSGPAACRGTVGGDVDSRAALTLDCGLDPSMAAASGSASTTTTRSGRRGRFPAARTRLAGEHDVDGARIIDVTQPPAHRAGCADETEDDASDSPLSEEELEELAQFREDVEEFGLDTVYFGALMSDVLPFEIPNPFANRWAAMVWEKIGETIADEAAQRSAFVRITSRSIKDVERLMLHDAIDRIHSLSMGAGDAGCADQPADGTGTDPPEPAFHCGTAEECVNGRGSSHIKGEPHLRTFDGLRISFQAAGEFVQVDTEDVSIQVRFEGTPGRNTRTTATAIRVGSSVVEIHYADVKAATRDGQVPVRIDGENTALDGEAVELGEALAAATVRGKAQNVYLSTPGGWFVAVENLNVSQNVIIVPPSDPPGSVVGLAGTPDDDRTNDLRTRDGAQIPLDELQTVAGLYGTVAGEWRVRPDERLFTDTPAEQWLTAEFTDLPDVVLSLGDIPSEEVAAARKACRDAGVPFGGEFEDCVYDVAVGGDPAWAIQQATSDAGKSPAEPAAGSQRRADDPLFVAADRCREDELRGLLEEGADVNARREDDGWTALMFASQRSCPVVVEMLLGAGADPDARALQGRGAFPLYLASQNGRIESVRLLLAAGADIHAALENGDTAILIAAFRERTEVVSALLDAGADPDIARDDGVTPLMAAVQESDQSTVRRLLEAGAEPDRMTVNRLRTALHIGASSGDAGIVSDLLEFGADVGRRDASGDTPLHFAASDGVAAIVELLLQAGADPDAENDSSRTPRDVADASVDHLFS